MKAKTILGCAVVAAMTISPAFAAKKKMAKRAPQETSMPAAVVGGAVATAGAIATAPFNPALMGPVSTLNGPSCKPGESVTINGQKMRCQ